MKILYICNTDWFFISHRLKIAESAMKNGYKVFVAACDTGQSSQIRDKGIEFYDLPISRSGINLVNEVKLIFSLYKIYNKLKPDLIHHITLKPVIYGSLVSRLLNIHHVVNSISGLGFIFTKNRRSIVRLLMIWLMRVGFKRKRVSIIFQNTSDKEELENLGILSINNRSFIIKGVGVDLTKYNYSELPSFNIIRILFPTRMLWDKGVKELRIATDILKYKYKNRIQFVLAGMLDFENKAAVPSKFLEEWADGEYVKWIGFQKDMISLYKTCHIVVLPSYREGLPKSLIEACSIGRAIVTTDAIGCRDCVDDGINGITVPVGSSFSLSTALENLILSNNLIIEMGIKSREKALNEFDENDVIDKHLEIYKNLF